MMVKRNKGHHLSMENFILGFRGLSIPNLGLLLFYKETLAKVLFFWGRELLKYLKGSTRRGLKIRVIRVTDRYGG